MAQYNFKTTDKEITEYLDKQENVSKAIKEAIKIKQMYELNPPPKEIEEKPENRLEVKQVRIRY